MGMKRRFFCCLAKNTGKCSIYRAGRFCSTHASQYYSGIININGKRLRKNKQQGQKRYYSGCVVKNNAAGGCSAYINGRFCGKHSAQYYRYKIIDRNGAVIRGLNRLRYKECIAKNTGSGKCSPYHIGVSGRFCSTHRHQFRDGIIDKNGHILRAYKKSGPKRTYYGCVAKNSGTGKCTIYDYGRFCRLHKSQFGRKIIDKKGKKLREPKGRGNKKLYHGCIAKNKWVDVCTVYVGGKFCWKHRAQFYSGILDEIGGIIREKQQGRKERKYFECIAKNKGVGECGNYFGGRFCTRHHSQYLASIIDKNGKEIRALKGFGCKRHYNECEAKNKGNKECSAYVPGRSGRFCSHHRTQHVSGLIDIYGNEIRKSYSQDLLPKKSIEMSGGKVYKDIMDEKDPGYKEFIENVVQQGLTYLVK